jgi:hypothetical protein
MGGGEEDIDYIRRCIKLANGGDYKEAAHLLFIAGSMIEANMPELAGRLKQAARWEINGCEVDSEGRAKYPGKQYAADGLSRGITAALCLNKPDDGGQPAPTEQQMVDAGMLRVVAEYLAPRLASAYKKARADGSTSNARARAVREEMGLSRPAGKPSGDRAGTDEFIVAMGFFFSRNTSYQDLREQVFDYAKEHGLGEIGGVKPADGKAEKPPTIEYGSDGNFTCPKLPGGLHLARAACANLYQRGKRADPWETAHHCRGCMIGARHAGEGKPSSQIAESASTLKGWDEFELALPPPRKAHTREEAAKRAAKWLLDIRVGDGSPRYFFGADIERIRRSNLNKAIDRLATRILDAWKKRPKIQLLLEAHDREDFKLYGSQVTKLVAEYQDRLEAEHRLIFKFMADQLTKGEMAEPLSKLLEKRFSSSLMDGD